MERIKLVTDSASDIPDADLSRFDITMLSIPIAIDGAEYYERKSFTIEQFYRVLAGCKEIPATSRIPVGEYADCYASAWEQGYTSLINVTINAAGSGIYDSAMLAREHFYGQVPEAKERMPIYVVDSKTYAIGFGHPVVTAASMAKEGKTTQEILGYLEDWFSSLEIYLGLYSLQYAKRSGRITAAAAIVGEALGIRPIIAMIDGKTRTEDKFRGDKLMPQRLLELYRKKRCDPDAPVVIVRAAPEEPALELKQLLDKETGRDIPIYYAGASIVVNAGPEMLAIAMKGKTRGQPVFLTEKQVET